MDKDQNAADTQSTQSDTDFGTQEMKTSTPAAKPRALRGFAAMDEAKRREISRMGGRAAHESGHAHEWNSNEARAAGRLGGRARSHN
jgi:general stress protein YciG